MSRLIDSISRACDELGLRADIGFSVDLGQGRELHSVVRIRDIGGANGMLVFSTYDEVREYESSVDRKTNMDWNDVASPQDRGPLPNGKTGIVVTPNGALTEFGNGKDGFKDKVLSNNMPGSPMDPHWNGNNAFDKSKYHEDPVANPEALSKIHW